MNPNLISGEFRITIREVCLQTSDGPVRMTDDGYPINEPEVSDLHFFRVIAEDTRGNSRLIMESDSLGRNESWFERDRKLESVIARAARQITRHMQEGIPIPNPAYQNAPYEVGTLLTATMLDEVRRRLEEVPSPETYRLYADPGHPGTSYTLEDLALGGRNVHGWGDDQ